MSSLPLQIVQLEVQLALHLDRLAPDMPELLVVVGELLTHLDAELTVDPMLGHLVFIDGATEPADRIRRAALVELARRLGASLPNIEGLDPLEDLDPLPPKRELVDLEVVLLRWHALAAGPETAVMIGATEVGALSVELGSIEPAALERAGAGWQLHLPGSTHIDPRTVELPQWVWAAAEAVARKRRVTWLLHESHSSDPDVRNTLIQVRLRPVIAAAVIVPGATVISVRRTSLRRLAACGTDGWHEAVRRSGVRTTRGFDRLLGLHLAW